MTPSASGRTNAGGSSPRASSAATSRSRAVVGEHPLVVRLAPVGARGIAEEAALDRVAERRSAHEPQRAFRELGGRRRRHAARNPSTGRDGELRSSPEPAVQAILVLGQGCDGAGRARRRPGSSPEVEATDAAARASATASAVCVEVTTPFAPGLADGGEHLHEGRHAVHWPRREVGAGVERTPVGRREHRERPAELAREGGSGREVARVDVGMLLAVDLDGNEPLVEDARDRRIAEALPRHHVAPVARGVADRDEHGHIALACLVECRLAPREPVDGIVRRAPAGRGSVHLPDDSPSPQRRTGCRARARA